MQKFEIWTEGYSITGDQATASKLGESEGIDFNDAVKNYMNQFPDEGIESRGDRWVIWGCELFPTEEQARVVFG